MIKEYDSLNHYFWSFEALEAKNNRSDIGKTETSTLISRDLKKRGWRFVGPTTVYSFMQSLGIVNDHDRECFRYPQIEKRIASFRKKTLR